LPLEHEIAILVFIASNFAFCTTNQFIFIMLLVVELTQGVINSLIYALLGIVMAVFAAKVVDWITPGQLFRQLVDEKNTPLAIFTGLLVLGICIIIAAAIAG
jgi:uncharacterized membrane protein YjfL (UPF0719 family)